MPDQLAPYNGATAIAVLPHNPNKSAEAVGPLGSQTITYPTRLGI